MVQTIAWVENDGTSHSLLSTSNYNTLVGMLGRWMPPVDISSYPMPLTRVSRVQRATYRPRILTLPIHVEGTSEQDHWAKRRELNRWFRPALDGYLRIACPDGSSTRELVGRYHGGLDGDESPERFGETWSNVTVEIFCADSLWRDATATTPSAYSGGDTPTITNLGDEETWPIWTISGACSGIEVDNTTTGFDLHLTFATPLSGGQSVVIDTLAGTVTRNDGSSEYASIEDAAAASLWPLRKGTNALAIAVAGGAATVALSYRARWFSP